MPTARVAVLTAMACTAVASPALAIVVPTSGSSAGFDWTTFPLGPTNSPSAIASAFGQLWVPDTTTGSGQLNTVDPATGAVTAQYTPAGAPRGSAILAQGKYVWIGGPRNQGARVIAVDQTGTTRLTFNGPVKSSLAWGGYPGVGLAYGAGAIWVSDQNANRVYAISPTTGRLMRTITVSAPRSVAVSGKTVWVTNARALQVTMFSASTGKRVAVGSAKTDPGVMAAANGTMWVFGENVITGFSLKTLEQTTTVRIPGAGGGSGWAGVVNVGGTLWLSNYVASVMAFNPATRTVTTQGVWSNRDFAGGIAAANGSLWVADGSTYAFPLGFGVTRITPTPAL
jgi:hypothetical protein